MKKADLSKLVAGDMIVSDSNRVYYVADVYENSILVKWNFKEDEFKELKKSSLISHYEIMSEEEAIAYLDIVDALIKNNVGSEENWIEFESDRGRKCAIKCQEWEIKNQVYLKDSNDQLYKANLVWNDRVCINEVYSKKWGPVSLHQLRGYTLVDEQTANELRAEAWEEYLEREKRWEEQEAKEKAQVLLKCINILNSLDLHYLNQAWWELRKIDMEANPITEADEELLAKAFEIAQRVVSNN